MLTGELLKTKSHNCLKFLQNSTSIKDEHLRDKMIRSFEDLVQSVQQFYAWVELTLLPESNLKKALDDVIAQHGLKEEDFSKEEYERLLSYLDCFCEIVKHSKQ